MWNKIKCPTMILQGAYDPLSWNQRISNDIKKYNNIELQVLPTHHLLTTAKPSLVMQKLEVFWR